MIHVDEDFFEFILLFSSTFFKIWYILRDLGQELERACLWKIVAMSKRTCVLVYLYSPFAFTCHVDDFDFTRDKLLRHLLSFGGRLYTQFYISSL